MAITYVKGDATQPQGRGNKIIAHICNDLGGWGKGFVLAISKRWKEPEAAYRSWHRDRAKNDFALGAFQLVQVEPYIWVANMVGQKGMETGSQGPPIRYEAVRACLKKLTVQARGRKASVHMSRIGCGLAETPGRALREGGGLGEFRNHGREARHRPEPGLLQAGAEALLKLLA